MRKISCILLIVLIIHGSAASLITVLGPMKILFSLLVLQSSSTYISSTVISGDASSPYLSKLLRNIDGSVNNRNNINWGRAGWEMPRLTKPFYGDNKSIMIERRNARELSNLLGAVSIDE